jgi:hypothetical protein
MQYPQSLAENVHPSEGAQHALNFAGLGDLASTFFALNVPSTHPQDPREGTWEAPSHPQLDAWGFPQDTWVDDARQHLDLLIPKMMDLNESTVNH